MGAEERTSDRRADVPLALPAVMPFEVFCRKEYRPLVALAWGLTRSRESGEDIAQEALLSLRRAWERDTLRVAVFFATVAMLLGLISALVWLRRRRG